MNFHCLISFAYWHARFEQYLRKVPRERLDLMIDSGAYTAWTKGKPIKLDDYCKFLDRLEWLRPFHAVSLDVMGQPEETYNNFLTMKKRGYDVLPVFTRGDSLARLDELYTHSDYLLLGGIAVGRTTREYVRWFVDHNKGRQAHWLGFVDLDFVRTFRPTSVDSSSWQGGARFGNLCMWTGRRMRLAKQTDFRVKPPAHVLEQFANAGITYGELHRMARVDAWGGNWKPEGDPVRGFNNVLNATAHLLLSNHLQHRFGTRYYIATAAHAHFPALVHAYLNLLKRNPYYVRHP